MLRHREVVGPRGLLCEDAYFVDEVGDELAPPDVEYLDRLSGSLEGRAVRSRGRWSRSRRLLGGLPLSKGGPEHTAHRQTGVPQGQNLWRRPDAARRLGGRIDGTR